MHHLRSSEVKSNYAFTQEALFRFAIPWKQRKISFIWSGESQIEQVYLRSLICIPLNRLLHNLLLPKICAEEFLPIGKIFFRPIWRIPPARSITPDRRKVLCWLSVSNIWKTIYCDIYLWSLLNPPGPANSLRQKLLGYLRFCFG